MIDRRQALTEGRHMVRIPAGPFLFGPQKVPVVVGEFWIDPYPISNAELARVVPEHRFVPHRASRPATWVNWDAACRYLDRVGLVLAKHRPAFVLYLSATLFAQVVEDLADSLPQSTPVVVAHKVGWPAEWVVRGTLADITQKVREAGIFAQAVIMIGDVFGEGVRQAVPERFW